MLALALLALIRPAGGGPTLELVPALIALALLFPLVVVERLVAESTIEALSDREALVRLLRVPSAVTAIAGLALLAASMGWPMA